MAQDVFTKCVSAEPIKEGWITAYVTQGGTPQEFPPRNYRLSTDALGILPTVPGFSGLVDRFDDTTYYTA